MDAGRVAAGAFASLLAAVSFSAQPDPAGPVGKPFRLSASVTEYCSMQPPAMMCEAFRPALDEFLAETRDPQWAVKVEPLIFDFIQVNEQPWAEIRALECRRTMCALEYAVSVDDLNHDADGNEELERLMDPVAGVVVPEVSPPPGKGNIVSVLIWRKRT